MTFQSQVASAFASHCHYVISSVSSTAHGMSSQLVHLEQDHMPHNTRWLQPIVMLSAPHTIE